MIRSSATALAFFTLAAISVPAAASAAPVNPPTSVLSASEFPMGTTKYQVSTDLVTKPERSYGESRCERASFDRNTANAGATSSEANVRRGQTLLAAGLINRSVAAQTLDFWQACLADEGLKGRNVPAPADLAQRKPRIFAVDNALIQAVVEVRGVTVIAASLNRDGGTADIDGFWQVLRAQIAKVERQP